MKDEHIVFGASITAALLFMLSTMRFDTIFDIVLWAIYGLGLVMIPNYVFKYWRVKVNG